MALEDLIKAYPTLGQRTREPQPRTPVGQGLHGLSWALGGLGDIVARRALLPVASKFADDEGDVLKQLRLQNLSASDSPITAGDILQESNDFLRTSPEAPWGEKLAKGAVKFGASTLLDPLTYVGLGLPTKLGKTAAKITAAKLAERSVELESPVAKALGELMGEKVTPDLIRRAPKGLEGRPLAEQIEKGHRSLLSLDVPFTDVNVPIPGVGTGKAASLAAKPFTALNRAAFSTRVGKEFKRMFSTQTGNPEFDKMMTRFKELADYRAGNKVLEGINLEKEVKNLAGDLGIERKELNRILTQVVERQTTGVAARGIQKIATPIAKALGKTLPKKTSELLGAVEGDKPNFLDELLGPTGMGEPDQQLLKQMYPTKADEEAAMMQGWEPVNVEKPFDKHLTEIGYKEIMNSEHNDVHIAQDKETAAKQLKMAEEAVAKDPSKKVSTYTLPGELSQLGEDNYFTVIEPNINPNSPVAQLEQNPHWHNLVNTVDQLHPSEHPEAKSALGRVKSTFLEENPRVLGSPEEQQGFLAELSRAAEESSHIMNKVQSVFPWRGGEPGDWTWFMDTEQKNAMESWVGNYGHKDLQNFARTSEANPVYYASVQHGLEQLGFKKPEDLIPVYVGKQKRLDRVASERPYSYGSLSPYIAAHFAARGNLSGLNETNMQVYRYMVPRSEVIAQIPGGEYEVFFRTPKVKQVTRNSFPIAPVFATAPGQFSWLNPETPTKVLMEVMDWVDGHIGGLAESLGAAAGEEGKKPKFNETLIRLKAWIQRMLGDRGIELPPSHPEIQSQVDDWKLLDKMKEDELANAPHQAAVDEMTGSAPKPELPNPTPENNYIPPAEDPRIAQAKAAIDEKGLRERLIAQSDRENVIPPTADAGYLTNATTQETRTMIRDWMVRSGQTPGGIKSRDFNQRLAKLLKENFLSVNEETVDKWLSDKLISGQVAKGLKGKHQVENLEDLLQKGTISEDQYAQAILAPSSTEINQMAQEGKLGAILGYDEVIENGIKRKIPRTSAEFFHSDPIFSSTMRGVRGEKAKTYGEFYQELIDRGIGVPEAEAPPDFVPVLQPELKGHRFEPEVARLLNNQYRFQRSPQDWNAFLKMFDKTQDWWKAWTLGIFPSYHVRNVISNLWQNWLADVYDPRVYRDAGLAAKGIAIKFVDGLGKTWNTKELIDTASELGVLNRGLYGAEVERSILEQIKGAKWGTLSQRNKLLQKGYQFGRTLENNARLAHFISKLKEGLTPEDAALSVKKYLFDYGDLTDTERHVLKRLFPFYTWTRKNIPLQLASMLEHPYKFAAPFRVKEEVERGTQTPNERYLPQWMIENFPTRVRYNEKTKDYEYFLAKSWLPGLDVVKLLELHNVAANMLSPIPKEVLQQAFNYDIFMNRKIEDYSGDTQKFLGIPRVPKRIVHGAKILRLLNEVDKMTADDTDVANKITSLLTGKTYLYNEDKARISNKYRVDHERDDLEQRLRQEARGRRNPDEMAKIRALIREKAREY